MQEELSKTLMLLSDKIIDMEKYLDINTKRNDLKNLEEASYVTGFWDDQKEAQRNIAESNKLKQILAPYDAIKSKLEDAEVLLELVSSSEEESYLEVVSEVESIETLFQKLEIQILLGEKYDFNNAFLTLHAGAGGTESCDWADMLYRMFSRYTEREGFKIQVLDYQPGDEAGIKSVSVLVEGDYAYGLLKSERGVHRLVRISPFDSQSRRHTSFSAADVSPQLSDDIQIEINESELRIDTFRAQGAGGQHVNTTDSAVRIVHLPSGTVVQCQAERSQHKNRATAMSMLKARLYEIEEDKKKDALDQLYSTKGDISWGSQIRSYVMQPYTLVKDHRTDTQVGNIQDVLDGNIKPFVYAFLKRNEV